MLFKPSKEFKEFINLKIMDKVDSAYKTIGEVAKILNLKSNKKGDFQPILLDFGKLNLSK